MSPEKKEIEELPVADLCSPTHEDTVKQECRIQNETWITEHVNKDFLLGKVRRKDNQLFVKVDEKHTERNIYLIHPVYEAYKKMFEAALADSVKLTIRK